MKPGIGVQQGSFRVGFEIEMKRWVSSAFVADEH